MTNSVSRGLSKLDTKDDYIELCLNNTKNLTDKEESDSSPSPPSYAVFEDEHGDLINPALNVIWPARPHKGRYSLNEYKEQKQRLQKYTEQRQKNKKCGKCIKRSERRPDVSHAYTSKQAKDSSNIYIGVRSESSLLSVLEPTEFRIFYMRPEPMNSFDQMPVKMPLMLAYKSSSGKVYNFNLKRHKYASGTFWQLDLSGIEGPRQPIFRSMSALVRHYKSFVIDRGDGTSEIFPVD